MNNNNNSLISFVNENANQSKGNYLFDSIKENNGECKIRITSPFTMGYLYWIDNPEKPETGKPVYTESCVDLKGVEGLRPYMGNDSLPTVPRPFLAVSVYNYTTKQVELFTITQKTIMGMLIDLVQDEDWGDPTGYDIRIKKEGEKLSTKYSLTPSNKSPIGAEVIAAVEATYCNPSNMLKGIHAFDEPTN